MLPPVLTLAGLLVVAAHASFDGNINYLSPSSRHPSLGIDVGLVDRRSWKRGNVAFEPSQLSFTHGVASGDPWPESVILWTRIAPSSDHETNKFVNANPNPICLEWSVFTSNDDDDPDVSNSLVASGQVFTSSDIDYTVKVEARSLEPLTQYNYQFNVCGSDKKSPMGRTKTAPRPDDEVSEMSFAVFSCSNFPTGYFNAYGNAARKDKHDFVIHLGDYIYEYEAGGERASIPRAVLFNLYDYRSRHGQYRTDPDLQLLSKNHAWIPTWDDHEFSDNGFRDGFSGLNNTEDSFMKSGARVTVDTRKVNAVRAYFEWMPIRQTDLDDGLRVWRSFQMGKLLDIIMLDTRNYDRSITTLGWNDHYIDLIRDDPSRTLMGSRQENWFYDSLKQSQDRGAHWRIVGNQIVFSRVFDNDKGDMSGDDWNGYIANRNRTLKHIFDNRISNNIFLAGDSHQNWVSDLAWLGTKAYDKKTGRGAVGVEFAGTAVTSTGQYGPIEPVAGDSARGMIRRNDEMQWQEGYYRGYFILHVRPGQTRAEFYGSPSVATRNPWDLPLANFTISAGQNHLDRPVANGRVESGAVRDGMVKHTNLTLNTQTGEWAVVGFERMYL
ncbi:phoD-like phosphatase domain-containing protein [Hirsutella rhossiliensis]|uniref:PhoD-like phosphatase domain-containing protein n=1 Tax=Hirsutella rhossiliensis TaxID=111463 RepID=A0A9P8SI55_9HYPO|nr:phoD-like phosphatase domain-containing protein [Hirsutella rhossiliensis]KAH0962839.1 phoD-like phosphatase domain-containing protein [Hirsutella rhossiliensis]